MGSVRPHHSQPRRIMAARIGDSMPCETLYACNLCDKVKKEELRALLYTLFVQYGDVIDIVHMRTAKMRGQAFIVFEETSSATAALRALQGFNFLGREVKLEFARSKSFATAKRDGTFKPMQKEAEKRKAAAAAAVQLAKRANQTENGMEVEEEEEEQAPAPAAPEEAQVEGSEEPNSILFVQGLPREVNAMMLEMLFKQFKGFLEARMVPGKPGIAFVEYNSEAQSGTAMHGLQGFKVTAANPIKIAYAKK